MKILLISTLGHNPGDDFIRYGQEWLLSQAFPDAAFVVMHKHDPRTGFAEFTRRAYTPHRLVAPLLYRWHRRSARVDLLAAADIVVFAGTPFIWKQETRFFPSTSANAEWISATWRRLLHEFPDKPVLNLAAGTSLNEGQTVRSIISDDGLASFLQEALSRTALTTARDRLTADVLRELGRVAPVIPCTSLWAADGAGLTAHPPEYVAFNVMRRAVHKARGKRMVSGLWRRNIVQIVESLSALHRVRFICHSRDEARLVREWFPKHELLVDSNAREILSGYSRALFTVSNRVHGAGGAASFRRPAIGIGGDSRISLLTEFGLPTFSASSATVEEILSACAEIQKNYSQYVSGLYALAERARDQYVTLIRSAVAP